MSGCVCDGWLVFLMTQGPPLRRSLEQIYLSHLLPSMCPVTGPVAHLSSLLGGKAVGF